MYFAGWTIGCVVVPRLGDLIGRRWPCLVSAIISCFVYLTIVLSKNLDLTTAMFFFLGLTCPAKANITYVYLLEFAPNKFQTYLGTMLLFADGSTTILISLYFRFISKDWLGFQIFGLVLTFLSTFALFFVPESPKYLWSAKKYKEAREKLEYIARLNMKKGYNRKFKFETEVQEEQKERKKIRISFNSSTKTQDVHALIEKLDATSYEDQQPTSQNYYNNTSLYATDNNKGNME